jgi:putative chitinase
MTTSTSPCGKNPALEEAKNKATELKEKVNGGLDALSDLPTLVAQLRAALEEINNKPDPNLNLQAELAKLPYLTPNGYRESVKKLRLHFSKTVENLEELIEGTPKPPALIAEEKAGSLLKNLKDLAANVQALREVDTQQIIDSLKDQAMTAVGIKKPVDLCKDVPNVEVSLPEVKGKLMEDALGVYFVNGEAQFTIPGGTKNEAGQWVNKDGDELIALLDSSGQPVRDSSNMAVLTTRPAKKPEPPPTPATNPRPEPKPSSPPAGGFTFTFTKEKFVKAAGPAAAAWYDAALIQFPKFGITTPERIAAFIGQVRTETAFASTPNRLQENLNYSAARLVEIFRKYFKTLEDALSFEKKPEKIANVVYANRMLNGPPASGDGWRYRGRGLKQLTGKDNYTRFSKALYGDDRLVRNPDVVATDLNVAMASACWFWKTNNLSALADKQDFYKLSVKVNGGTIGIENRLKFSNEALKVLKA